MAPKFNRVNFARVNAATSPRILDMAESWLPGGRICGSRYLGHSFHHNPRHPGAICIDLRTGRWRDTVAGEGGPDIISLYAYLNDVSQVQAAREVAALVGLEAWHVS
jgi:putative DNA primase/helicase